MIRLPCHIQIKGLISFKICILIRINTNCKTASSRRHTDRFFCRTIIITPFGCRTATIIGRIIIRLCLRRTPGQPHSKTQRIPFCSRRITHRRNGWLRGFISDKPYGRSIAIRLCTPIRRCRRSIPIHFPPGIAVSTPWPIHDSTLIAIIYGTYPAIARTRSTSYIKTITPRILYDDAIPYT